MSPGTLIYWKQYKGVVRFVYGSRLIVTLYHYHGLDMVDREVSAEEVEEDGQISFY
jgi:hypothetical protein